MTAFRPKMEDLLSVIRNQVAAGAYVDTRHFQVRKRQRVITIDEVLQVLESGVHEGERGRFNDYHEAWEYAIRGKTIDGRTLAGGHIF